MCRIDDAERPEFFSARTSRARKAHRCGECGRNIEPGEEYESATGKWDGDVRTEKTCLHCCGARGWLDRECGGHLFSEVLEELREHWQEEESYRTRELAGLIWGMRRRWRRRDGRMMAVPVVPAHAAAH